MGEKSKRNRGASKKQQIPRVQQGPRLVDYILSKRIATSFFEWETNWNSYHTILDPGTKRNDLQHSCFLEKDTPILLNTKRLPRFFARPLLSQTIQRIRSLHCVKWGRCRGLRYSSSSIAPNRNLHFPWGKMNLQEFILFHEGRYMHSSAGWCLRGATFTRNRKSTSC